MASSVAGLGASTTSHIVVSGNRCYDDRGPGYQKYGLRLGLNPANNPAPPNAYQPQLWTVMGNDFFGNVSAGIYVPSSNGVTVVRDHLIGPNLGDSACSGYLLFRAVVGSSGAVADFTIPIAVTPSAGRLYVEAVKGDDMASGYFRVSHTNSGSATNSAPSAGFGVVQQGAGAMPTLAAGAGGGPTGTYRLTTTWATTGVTYSVIWQPDRLA
jgi:hypothetical protein